MGTIGGVCAIDSSTIGACSIGGVRPLSCVSAIGNSGVGGCDVGLNSGVGAVSSLNTGSLLRGNHCGALASS